MSKVDFVHGHTAPKRAFTQNSRAYLLTICAYMGIFIFGYDTGVGGGVIALGSFSRDFHLTGSATYVANTQGNVVSILQGGCFFGALGGAPLTTWIGRQRTLIIGCIVFIVGAIIQVVATSSIAQFYVGRLVCGLAVGAMSMVCPTYVSELAPKEIRGRITGLFQVVVVIGVAVSYWINYGVAFMSTEGHAQWRVPIGFQLVPVGTMLLLLPFLKESPRWLATKHRDEEALRNLAWIRKTDVEDPETVLEFAEIVAAIKEEEANAAGPFYREFFVPGNPIRFAIAFMMFMLQQASGQNSINYFAPTIFKSIGIVGNNTSLLASGIYGIVKIVATSIFVAFGIDRFGRRMSLFVGVSLMAMFLFIIGAIFHTHPPQVPAPAEPSHASIAMAAMIYLFVIPYCFSVGPVPWVYCSEIFNNRTRAHGLAVASSTQWFFNFIFSRFTLNMVLTLKNGGIFFFFAAINVISAGLCLLLPETKGRSLESMDLLFGAVSQEKRDQDIAREAVTIEAETHKDTHSEMGDEKKDLKGEHEHVERA